ncbi:hypothetical protein A0257_04095 [Hymenobacter psoromatis]|nr:hypothetical protein A0257_04095 [Hymenobacter psoromatis]
MNLADHLRPLLRDHDCVIIPDFGGLVAAYVPARVQPGGRHHLSPPTRQVAFNQALTRNDGLLVDALCQHLGLPAAEAREALRQAVAALYHDLHDQQRTELPGIGVFRQLAGRGLQFEYTGANDLLPAVFGLPELTVLPVSVIDARLAREQQAQLGPRLRSAGRGLRLRRVVPATAIGLLAGLTVAGLYLFNLHPTMLPAAWQSHVPRWEQTSRSAAPQQAALAQPSFTLPTAAPAVPPAEVVAVKESVAADASWDAAPVAPASAPAKELATTPAQAQPFEQLAEVPAPADLTALAPTSVALAATPLQTAPPRTVDPVNAMLSQRAPLPSPIAPRARGRARKLPAAAAIAVANESNIARPIPMALRKAGTPTMVTTSYAAARNAAPLPAPASPAAAPAHSAPVAAAPKVVVAPKAIASKVVAPAKVKWVAPAKKPARATWTVAAKAKPAAPIVAKAKTLAPMAAKKVVAPAALAVEGAINARTGRYYVVVAAYDSRARAEQGRRNLLHAGHANAKIIMPYPGTRHYRLSAADYADRPAAQLAATQLRKNPRVDNGLTVFPY